MTKLTEIVNNLTASEIKELIDIGKSQLEYLNKEEKVKLIAVSKGILIEKYFRLSDEDKAISFCHKYFDSELALSKKRGFLNSEVCISIKSVPVSDVDKYLE